MKLQDVSKQLGRRDFLRSAAVLGTGTTLVGLTGCSDGSPLEIDAVHNVQGGARWMRLDASGSNGIFMSLDTMLDDTAEPGAASDRKFEGHVILPAGEILPLVVTLEGDYANAVTTTSLGDNRFRILAPGSPATDVSLSGRTIPDTGVLILMGQITDAIDMGVVSFSITISTEQSPQAVSARRVSGASFNWIEDVGDSINNIGKGIEKIGEGIKTIGKGIKKIGEGVDQIINGNQNCKKKSVSGAGRRGMASSGSAVPTSTVTMGLGDVDTCGVDCGGDEHDQGGGS